MGSYITRCSFCRFKVEVPDDAVGERIICPKCSKEFVVQPRLTILQAPEPVKNLPVPGNLSPQPDENNDGSRGGELVPSADDIVQDPRGGVVGWYNSWGVRLVLFLVLLAAVAVIVYHGFCSYLFEHSGFRIIGSSGGVKVYNSAHGCFVKVEQNGGKYSGKIITPESDGGWSDLLIQKGLAHGAGQNYTRRNGVDVLVAETVYNKGRLIKMREFLPRGSFQVFYKYDFLGRLLSVKSEADDYERVSCQYHWYGPLSCVTLRQGNRRIVKYINSRSQVYRKEFYESDVLRETVTYEYSAENLCYCVKTFSADGFLKYKVDYFYYNKNSLRSKFRSDYLLDGSVLSSAETVYSKDHLSYVEVLYDRQNNIFCSLNYKRNAAGEFELSSVKNPTANDAVMRSIRSGELLSVAAENWVLPEGLAGKKISGNGDSPEKSSQFNLPESGSNEYSRYRQRKQEKPVLVSVSSTAAVENVIARNLEACSMEIPDEFFADFDLSLRSQIKAGAIKLFQKYDLLHTLVDVEVVTMSGKTAQVIVTHDICKRDQSDFRNVRCKTFMRFRKRMDGWKIFDMSLRKIDELF